MGDPPWGCGWGGGRSCGFPVWAGERARDSSAPANPVQGPRRKLPRAARLWPEERRPWEPASRPRRPPSPALLPGCARAVPALSRGLRREPPSGLYGTLPLRTGWRRRGSAAGQSVSPEVRPRVPVRGPSFGQPSWLESATSPRCFCFSFEHAIRSSGRVIFSSLLLHGRRYIFKGSLSSKLPLSS